MNDPKSPETTSTSYDQQVAGWAKVQTVLDGTDAMRAAGQRYLPMHAKEAQKLYDERLSRCTLLNRTRMTLSSWVGRPFSKPLLFEKVPPPIEALFDDIDRLGNDVQVFCRNWFEDGLAKAFSHVLVEFPKLGAGQLAGGARSLADDRVDGARPHWIHLRPEQVFFADSQVEGGVERLREVRIREEVYGREGFAETCQPQIRRLLVDDAGVVQVEIYRLADPKHQDKRLWKLFESYPIDIPQIPLVTFYADRTGFMCGTSPIKDLVDLNIAHWQSTSEQRAILTVTRFPILVASGMGAADKELVVGPNLMIRLTDPKARVTYVEHSGNSIDAGRQDLADLDAEMSSYGAEFLQRRPNPTATGRLLDSAEATSPLQDVAIRFGHAVNQALEMTALWMKLGTWGTAKVHTQFSGAGADPAQLQALKDARQMKDISREAYLAELARRGVLGEDFDAEADALLLEDESLKMDPAPLEAFDDPQKPAVDDEEVVDPKKKAGPKKKVLKKKVDDDDEDED